MCILFKLNYVHKKKKKKKKSKATVYEKLRSLWFHVFSTRIFVKSGYSYIPEFSIETSSINAVFAQITVKS